MQSYANCTPSPYCSVSHMNHLQVSIDKIIDFDFPFRVEFSFKDRMGIKHQFDDKLPIVSDKVITENADLPMIGSLRCTIVDLVDSDHGQYLVVNTEVIDGVKSNKGICEFSVNKSQVGIKPANG